jgi:hypothetical protein
MPLWLTLSLLFGSVLLWCLGAGNRDEVIGLLERLLAVAAMAVVLLVSRPWLLELAGVIYAIWWLPRARGRLEDAPAVSMPGSDLLMPF